MIRVTDLNIEFFDHERPETVVYDFDLTLHEGEIVGLVGESGSGKSTAARCVMNIYQPCAGQIYYKGIDTCDRGQFRKNKKMLQTTRQMIFQDSGSSLNQRMKVRDIIEEPMRVQKIRPLRGSYEEEDMVCRNEEIRAYPFPYIDD